MNSIIQTRKFTFRDACVGICICVNTYVHIYIKFISIHIYKKKEALNLKITMGIHMVWWRERKERNDVSKQRKN